MRFIRPDRTVESHGPQSLNRYSYALDSPLVGNDTSGLILEKIEEEVLRFALAEP
ncbi:MAG: hypothetical protein ACKVVT_04635 [Dehalococcoidia bacterium]